MNIVLTYGTFDLFHEGHVNLFECARSLGDRLIVAVPTDDFNLLKGKVSFFAYSSRARIVAACRHVDLVIPETSWAQKRGDIVTYGVSTLVMGSDWTGHFNELQDLCKVVYLPRTEGISTSFIKGELKFSGKIVCK